MHHTPLSSLMNSVACPLAQFGRGQAVFSIFWQMQAFPCKSSSGVPAGVYQLLWEARPTFYFPHGWTLWPAPWPNFAEGRQEHWVDHIIQNYTFLMNQLCGLPPGPIWQRAGSFLSSSLLPSIWASWTLSWKHLNNQLLRASQPVFYCTFSSHLLFPHLDSAWHLVDRFFMMWCWWALNLMPREASSGWLILQCSLTEPQMRCLSHGWNLSPAPWPHLAEGRQFSLFFHKEVRKAGSSKLNC